MPLLHGIMAVPNDFALYGSCKSIRLPWSVINNSTANASLATVLAGFMITATAFLLNKQNKPAEDDAGVNTHAIALFASGVLVLGLDAYLFSTISAVAPVVGSDGKVPDRAIPACFIAWTQGMPASSMLAIGGSAMVAGLGSMITQHVVMNKVTSKAISVLPGILTLVILITTSLLLTRYARNYVNVLTANFGKSFSGSTSGLLWVGWLLFSLMVVAIFCVRVGGLLFPCLVEGKDSAELLKPRLDWLATTSILMALLAFAGPLYAGFVSEATESAPLGVPSSDWVNAATALGLLPVVLIQLPMALSMPGARSTDYKEWITQKGRSTHWRAEGGVGRTALQAHTAKSASSREEPGSQPGTPGAGGRRN